MDYEPIIALAKKHFYQFHRHPELSGKEVETTRHIKAFLTQQGISFYDLPLETGVVAHLGNGQGPVVALRCDIDALPLQEETGLPYQSEIPGRMHACGHDFHTANLLGTALVLKAGGPIPGTLKLIFQPAEEKLNGALKILETGILDDVQVIFGIHCCAAYERGTVISRPGFMNGAVDEFQVSFQGKGSHACRPQLSADPVIMLGQFIAAAQTIVSRNRPPFHPLIVGIGHVESGTAANIIPDTAFAEGTIRSLYPEDRELAKSRLQTLAEGIGRDFGGSANIRFLEGPPATNNTAEWVDFVRDTAQQCGLPFAEAPDSLSGEDFAFYQQKIPGAFIQMGTGIGPMMHNSHFAIDPETFRFSIPFSAALLRQALSKLPAGDRHCSLSQKR